MVGDVNGDGSDDLLVGARYGDGEGNSKLQAGESYLFCGGAAIPTLIDMRTLGIDGVTIYGADEEDASGTTVSGIGDINNDEIDDFIVSASGR